MRRTKKNYIFFE